jgi:hypothetical protein
MKQRLTFEIECGEKSCASEPGKFCQFANLAMAGKDSCYFFGLIFYDKPHGWLQRHPDCLKLAQLSERK